MIEGSFMVVTVDADEKNQGKYRRVQLSDGDGLIPVAVPEGVDLPPALTSINARIKLDGFQRSAKSPRTGNEYVATSIVAQLVSWEAAGAVRKAA